MKKIKVLNPQEMKGVKGGKRCLGTSAFTKTCVTIETKLCATLEIQSCMVLEVKCQSPFSVLLDDGTKIGW